jgi:hypothetical protein
MAEEPTTLAALIEAQAQALADKRKPELGQLHPTGDSKAFIRLRTWTITDIIHGALPYWESLRNLSFKAID